MGSLAYVEMLCWHDSVWVHREYQGHCICMCGCVLVRMLLGWYEWEPGSLRDKRCMYSCKSQRVLVRMSAIT